MWQRHDDWRDPKDSAMRDWVWMETLAEAVFPRWIATCFGSEFANDLKILWWLGMLYMKVATQTTQVRGWKCLGVTVGLRPRGSIRLFGRLRLKIVCKGASTIGGKSIAAWKLHKERLFRCIIEERRICAWLRERSDSDEDTEYSCWGFEFWRNS